MKIATKICFATAFILVGAIIFVCAMTKLNWDFKKLSTDKYQTNEYEINEPFKSVSINTDTADIIFAPSEDSKAYAVCYEQENIKHTVEVKDGVLVIESVDTRKWYEYVGINIESPKITVYLPNAENTALVIEESTGDIEISKDLKFKSIDISLSTGDVKCFASATEEIKIESSTGDITVSDISAASLRLSVTTGRVTASNVICSGDVTVNVSTGKTYLSNIACKRVISDGSTGGISLKDVIAEEKISIERSTGDVRLEASDAAEIFVKTSTGDVEGSLLTDKVFITETDTGRVIVPSSAVGGRCQIITDTGDIEITVFHPQIFTD